MQRTGLWIASVALAALSACGSGGSDGEPGSSTNDSEGDKTADAKACRTFEKLPDNASNADTEKVIEVAKSEALTGALKELTAYPEDLGLEDIDKLAATYEKIRAACSESDVRLPSFSDLMGGGEAATDLPACPETNGQKLAYADIVKMNAEGCVDSKGGESLVVYGGKCSDGRQFAYKNLSDIEPDPDGKDDRAYVIAAPSESGTVVVDRDEQSDAMFKLEMDCNK